MRRIFFFLLWLQRPPTSTCVEKPAGIKQVLGRNNEAVRYYST
jgi:hypothetical protein